MTKLDLFIKACELGLIKGDCSLYVMDGYSKKDLELMIKEEENSK